MALNRFRGRRRWAALVAASVVVPTMLLTACGGSSSGAGTSGTSGTSSDDTATVAGFPSLATLYKGDEGVPPTTAPKPAAHKDIWWISCGQQSASCADYAAAGKEAVQALGWTFHLADANLNQANGNATALRTAIAAHPDAIVEDAFSCSTVEPALEEAKAAHIPVIGVETLDCSEAGTGPSLFTVPLIYSSSEPNNKAWWAGFGKQAADYIVAASGGKAKLVATYEQGDPQFDLMNNAFKAELAKCSGCSTVQSLDTTPASQVPNGPWVTSLRTALVKHPNATWVWVPFDFLAVEIGGAKTVTESGTKASMGSGLGLSNALDLIRSGQLKAESYARSSEWLSWAAVDELNRYFDKQPSVPEGLGLVSIDKTHNLPATPGENYQTKVDFRALYKKAWGVS